MYTPPNLPYKKGGKRNMDSGLPFVASGMTKKEGGEKGLFNFLEGWLLL
jgi:hypothetical protein